MRGYTTISQSKKLLELGLKPESADMWWLYVASQGKYIAMMYEEPDPYYIARMESYGIKDAAIRCWSLAALLGVLPNGIVMNKDSQNGRYHFSSKYIGTYVTAGNPIDACYELILKLHELKML